MKKRIVLLVVVASFACCGVSRGSVTNAWWSNGGNNALVPSSTSFAGDSLSAVGIEYGSPAQMVGTIATDTPDDPTLFLGSSVDNDTGAIWIGYQVNVVMSQTFTFSGTPTISNPTADWLVANVAAPTLQVGGLYAGKYEGTIDFAAGTPLGIGEELDFSYAIHFASSTDYAFTQEMIPMFALVPEPSTLALAATGGLMLALRLRRKRAG